MTTVNLLGTILGVGGFVYGQVIATMYHLPSWTGFIGAFIGFSIGTGIVMAYDYRKHGQLIQPMEG